MATCLKCASLARVHARPVLGFYPRPLRPEPPASDQMPASGESSEKGEVKPAVISQPPQTNGDITEGQKQQRRQPRRRRQRNSESSTSKVGGGSSDPTLKSPPSHKPHFCFCDSERYREVGVRARHPASDIQTRGS